MPLKPNFSKPPERDIPPEWIEKARVICQRDGYAVKAGPENSILAQNINTGRWATLTFPGGSNSFESDAERDRVLLRLQSAS